MRLTIEMAVRRYKGAALDGSFASDTSTGTEVLVDWDLAVTQPGRFTPVL